ncbi:A/G-specific adenine glycosylase [Sporolactobacillus sp. CPB3-1]|uniref:Adenine DNA glycosylase n=1 Tax=Sporolactobacillus mangiferae TaxID=2940498 RepID=A0ABT0MAZ1_9BACL|nr:A/G-specific adenine glycosylase [Sporolactobacillus mangiferae]MCL1632041.1 A/G-specific adenine glycosylase [Sporolactobacillus mangiferae]
MNEQQIRNFNHDLLDWFHSNGRHLPWRETDNPYYIWVSEVMLQQTQVNTVIPYYMRFIRKFPTPAALADAPEQDVLKCWEGLGYYSRARHLQQGVREVVEKYDGQLPDSKETLLSISGIGPYTASALLSMAYDEPEPAIDGNLMRVLSRVFLIDDDIAKQKTRRKFEDLASSLITETDPGAFNQALMDIGAMICKPKHADCPNCPLRRHCLASEEGVQLEYPVKSGNAKPRPLHYAVLLIRDDDGRYLIEKRPDKGLLAGFWQFPMILLDEYEKAGQRHDYISERYGCEMAPVHTTFTYTHRFSHLIWHLTLLDGRTHQKPISEKQRLVAVADFDAYPFPVPHQKVIEWIKNNRQNHT